MGEVLDKIFINAAVEPRKPLTAAQEKTVSLMATGVGCGSVALSLRISRWTVRAHVRAVALLLPDDDLSSWERVRIWSILRARGGSHPPSVNPEDIVWSRRALYFMEAEITGLIKIGVSGNPEYRMSQLATTAGPLRLLGVFEGLERYEGVLHEVFAANRRFGEWFDPTENIREASRDPEGFLRKLSATKAVSA